MRASSARAPKTNATVGMHLEKHMSAEGRRPKFDYPVCVLYGRKRRSEIQRSSTKIQNKRNIRRTKNLSSSDASFYSLFLYLPRPSSSRGVQRGRQPLLVAFSPVFPDGKTGRGPRRAPARRGRPRGSGGESHSNNGRILYSEYRSEIGKS